MSNYGKYYTLKEVGEITQHTRTTLLHWIRDGKLQAVKVGSAWRVTQQTLDEMLGANPEAPATTTGQLFVNEDGRLQLDNRELTCGDVLQVLIVDGKDNGTRWVDTRVEYADGEYYLVGLVGYKPAGLFARI